MNVLGSISLTIPTISLLFSHVKGTRNMSNLHSAKSAIEAEINHAKQGLAFYQSRVETLEQMLEQLDSVIVPEGESSEKRSKPGKRAAKAETRTPGRRGRKAGAREEAGAAGELPSTAGDFWLNLVTDQPQSAAQVLKRAVGSLDFSPSRAQVQKLRQRLTPALKKLVETGQVQDSGAGRERRFFRARH